MSNRLHDMRASDGKIPLKILKTQPISKEYFIHLQLTVSDEGIGIRPQNLKKSLH